MSSPGAGGVALDGDRRDPVAAIDGGNAGDGCGLDAGESVEAAEDSFVEAVELGGFVAGEFGVEVDEQDVGAIEAEVLVLEVVEGAEEETCSGEEHEGEYDLCGDEDVGEQTAGASAGAGRGAGVGGESGSGADAGDAQRRGDAEEQRGQDGEAEGEGEDVQVGGGGEGGVAADRSRGDEADEETGSPEGEEQAECAADEGEQQGLGEDLADDAGAAGAEGEAGGELALAGGGFGEEEVGEVGAGDEKDEDDYSHEDVQRLLIDGAEVGDAAFAGEKFDEGLLDLLGSERGEGVAFVIAQILLGLRGDPCLGLTDVGAGFAAAHEVQPLKAVRGEHGGLLHDLRLHGERQPHVGRSALRSTP